MVFKAVIQDTSDIFAWIQGYFRTRTLPMASPRLWWDQLPLLFLYNGLLLLFKILYPIRQKKKSILDTTVYEKHSRKRHVCKTRGPPFLLLKLPLLNLLSSFIWSVELIWRWTIHLSFNVGFSLQLMCKRQLDDVLYF